MRVTKSPGPDGLGATFYKRNWDVIGLEVTTTILDILNNGLPFSHLNFGPISLYIVYKILSKVIANRVKPNMSYPISDSRVLLFMIDSSLIIS